MRDTQTSTQSVVSPPTATLQDLKDIAALFDTRSYTNQVRRVARAVRLTVGLGRKLTGDMISCFLDFALVPGSEAHNHLFSYVKTDQHDIEADTSLSTSQSPPKHIQAELEIYCYFVVFLFLIGQKKYNEAKVCSVATIGRLNSVKRRIVDGIASKLYLYYYLRYELKDDLVQIRSTLLALHQLATFQYEKMAKMSSSQLPVSSTQCSYGSNLDVNSREGRRRWTAPEDVVLISAWLNTSKDPIVGNEQKGVAFWERISLYYAASEAVVGKPKRGASQCKQRWKKINESVNKFVGCYSQASARRSSGQSDDDVLQMANELYFNDHQVKFALEHTWRKLMHDQKWCSSSRGNESSKRTKIGEGGAYSSSSNTGSRNEEVVCPRPPGVKAAKRKAKKSVSTADNEASPLEQFQKMWEIKEKDIAAREGLYKQREKLSKQCVLENLLAKPEISEDELNLKTKLIAEMLG